MRLRSTRVRSAMSGSSEAVGSSRSRSFGWLRSALVRLRRVNWPVGRWEVSFFKKIRQAFYFFTKVLHTVEPAESKQIFVDGEVSRKRNVRRRKVKLA